MFTTPGKRPQDAHKDLLTQLSRRLRDQDRLLQHRQLQGPAVLDTQLVIFVHKLALLCLALSFRQGYCDWHGHDWQDRPRDRLALATQVHREVERPRLPLRHGWAVDKEVITDGTYIKYE